MSTSRKFLIGLAIMVIVWYVGLSYLPQIVGTCLDGACGFSIGEIIISLVIPLLSFALPVGLEMVLHKKGLSQTLSDIGLTRFNWTGIRLAAVFLLPLIAFYPLFALVTHTPLVLQPAWHWLILSVLLNNGLAEETMMRGFVFRHLRERRPFWRAAALSTVYFAGYHLPLIFVVGPVFGIIAVVLAIPTGFVTAYIYERGNNTIWGTALLHVVYNSLASAFLFPTETQLMVTSLYLLVATGMAAILLVWAFRGRYGRMETHAIPQPSASSA